MGAIFLRVNGVPSCEKDRQRFPDVRRFLASGLARAVDAKNLRNTTFGLSPDLLNWITFTASVHPLAAPLLVFFQDLDPLGFTGSETTSLPRRRNTHRDLVDQFGDWYANPPFRAAISREFQPT